MSNNSPSSNGEDKLKEALDTASQQTRNLMITFLFFLLYVGVTAAGTTHRDLLFPDSTVKMPILGVDIPLFGFYIYAPFLMLIFHFNLLFNLFQHSKKFSNWRNTDGREVKLYPFLFNYVDKYPLVRFATWIIGFGAPLFLFVFIQTRFLPYHSLGMTFWHQIAVLIDMFLLLLFWQEIRAPKCGWLFIGYCKDLKAEIKLLFNKDQLKRDLILKNAKKFCIKICLVIALLSNLSILVFVALFCFKMAVIPPLDDSYKKEILEEVKDSALKKRMTKLSILSATGNFPLPPLSVDRGLLGFLNNATKDFYKKNLVLREKELVSKEPSDTIIAAYLRDDKKTVDDAWMDHAKGIDLSKRDLRYADFFNSKLIKADLENTNLQGVDLGGANLQGANLSNTNLQGASLGRANLQGVDLGGANLQGANLRYAIFQETNLTFANLRGANLSDTNLQGAVLGINLEGASLGVANLQGADLRGANLQGADLSRASLEGAVLSRASLYGARLPKKENQQGILANNVKNEPVDDWQKLIDEILPQIPEERRDAFKKLIRKAEKRTAESDYKLPVLNTDFEGFVSRRNELACQDKTIAKGMFNQMSFSPSSAKPTALDSAMKEVVAHMKNKCPENIPDDLNEWRKEFLGF